MGLGSYYRVLSLVQNMQTLGQLFEPLYVCDMGSMTHLMFLLWVTCKGIVSMHHDILVNVDVVARVTVVVSMLFYAAQYIPLSALC